MSQGPEVPLGRPHSDLWWLDLEGRPHWRHALAANRAQDSVHIASGAGQCLARCPPGLAEAAQICP